MNDRLEKLPEVAARQLGGLEAGPTLLCKIKLEAAENAHPRRRMNLRPVLAVCAALVLCVGAVMSMDGGNGPVAVDSDMPNVMDSRAAGSETVPTDEPRTAADVPKGAISMSAGRRTGAGSLFAQSDNASFPLVTLGGATYRLLESPDGITETLLGETLGTVSEFNIEPALGSGGVVSNVVSLGESIYAVGDMDGALVAAKVNDALRVFQRVSYAGTAVIGRETLADTLCDPADVEWIELDGMGRVSDAEQAMALMETLLEYADYQSTAFSGSTSMRVGLKNGLVLQLMTDDDSVSACGTWSCPDFFEAFAESVAQ